VFVAVNFVNYILVTFTFGSYFCVAFVGLLIVISLLHQFYYCCQKFCECQGRFHIYHRQLGDKFAAAEDREGVRGQGTLKCVSFNKEYRFISCNLLVLHLVF